MTASAAAPGLLRLLISCPDRPGIVAGVSRFLYENGANIIRSDQYSTDPEGGAFFLRMEFALAPEKRDGLAERFGLKVAEPLGMTWRLWDSARPKRISPAGLPLRPLPARPALALAARPARGGDRHGGLQPSRPG